MTTNAETPTTDQTPSPYDDDDFADAVEDAADLVDEHVLTDEDRADGCTDVATSRVARLAAKRLRQGAQDTRRIEMLETLKRVAVCSQPSLNPVRPDGSRREQWWTVLTNHGDGRRYEGETLREALDAAIAGEGTTP